MYESVTFSNIAKASFLCASFFLGGAYLYFVFKGARDNSPLFKNMLKEQFAVIVVLPVAALVALFIVSVLDIISIGKIEFNFFGLVLKGASGPVILWVIVFLSEVMAIKLLWKDS